MQRGVDEAGLLMLGHPLSISASNMPDQLNAFTLVAVIGPKMPDSAQQSQQLLSY
jgi:hypothetical protein